MQVFVCVFPGRLSMCVMKRIEAGTVRGPSGGEMGIRASSKSSEFVEEGSAI